MFGNVSTVSLATCKQLFCLLFCLFECSLLHVGQGDWSLKVTDFTAGLVFEDYWRHSDDWSVKVTDVTAATHWSLTELPTSQRRLEFESCWLHSGDWSLKVTDFTAATGVWKLLTSQRRLEFESYWLHSGDWSLKVTDVTAATGVSELASSHPVSKVMSAAVVRKALTQ